VVVEVVEVIVGLEEEEEEEEDWRRRRGLEKKRLGK
jgi:hypothetical protein